MHIYLYKHSDRSFTWSKALDDFSEVLQTSPDINHFAKIFVDAHITSSKVGDGGEHSYYKESELRLLHKKTFIFIGFKESEGVWLEFQVMINGQKNWDNYRDSIRASFESVIFDSSKAKKKLIHLSKKG